MSGRLPNGDRAILNIRKLSGYCLNPEHPRGRHKARVFWDALGIARGDAADLQVRLLDAAEREEATLLWSDAWAIDGRSTSRSRDIVAALW